MVHRPHRGPTGSSCQAFRLRPDPRRPKTRCVPPRVTPSRQNAVVVPVEITPRNASFAKACPQRVQLDVLRPCEPLPPSPFLEKLFQAGHDYEEETSAGLCARRRGRQGHRGRGPRRPRVADDAGHVRRSPSRQRGPAPGRPRGPPGRRARPPRPRRRPGRPLRRVAICRSTSSPTRCSTRPGSPARAAPSSRASTPLSSRPPRPIPSTTPGGGSTTCSSSPTIAGCSRRPGVRRRCATSAGSAAQRG